MIKTKHLRYASGSIRNLLLTAAFLVSALQTNAQAIFMHYLMVTLLALMFQALL